MSKSTILIQLDTDPHPSVFDAVVAVDAGVERLLQYGNVTPEAVQNLVFGALFTRGIKDLKSTAIFVGGSNVEAGEKLLKAVKKVFFGPFRVSVLMDSNGANTTAAAAVRSATKEVDLMGAKATVLAATGPVGQRCVRLLARQNAEVSVCSRKLDRARAVVEQMQQLIPGAKLKAVQTANEAEAAAAVAEAQVLIAAGGPGAELLSEASRQLAKELRVAIDLNAVPPVGLAGIDPQDKSKDYNGVKCYGALGVGGLKMKIHQAALRKLFESNDQSFDCDEAFTLSGELA